MLRDEREAALDDAIVGLKNAADAYRDASGLVGEGEGALADRLAAMAGRREAMAAALEPQLRRMGDFPSDPDSEAETLEQVVRHVAAVLPGDAAARIRDEVRSREAELAALLEAALAADPPRATADLLRQFLAEIIVDP